MAMVAERSDLVRRGARSDGLDPLRHSKFSGTGPTEGRPSKSRVVRPGREIHGEAGTRTTLCSLAQLDLEVKSYLTLRPLHAKERATSGEGVEEEGVCLRTSFSAPSATRRFP